MWGNRGLRVKPWTRCWRYYRLSVTTERKVSATVVLCFLFFPLCCVFFPLSSSRMSSPLFLGQLVGVPLEIMHPTMEKDTTYTKIFVGGLPYHTNDASLRKYFETFGDIDEAVVITDKQTGKSRGYGFVSQSKFICLFSARIREQLNACRVNKQSKKERLIKVLSATSNLIKRRALKAQ